MAVGASVALVLLATAANANDEWLTAQTSDMTIYACPPPACARLVTVAVSDPSPLPMPVTRSMLDEPHLQAQLAYGLEQSFGETGVLEPFVRTDLGAHVGLLGVVKGSDGAPMAVFVSFNGHLVKEFLASAATTTAAINAITVIAERVSPP